MSLGAAGQRLGVSSGDIRRAGYFVVTAGRLETWRRVIVVPTSGVAGYFDGYVRRIAAAGGRVGVHRAAALARAAVLDAPESRGPDG